MWGPFTYTPGPSAQLHSYTAAQLHSYTAAQLYSNTGKTMHSCPAVKLYIAQVHPDNTAVKLHSYTVTQLHGVQWYSCTVTELHCCIQR